MRIRPVRPSDAESLARLRGELWPGLSVGEHANELERFFAGRMREPLAILVAESAAGELHGFCELSIRAYAEGCATDHVAFLEGWYVVPQARRHGVGRDLVRAAEAWARSQGCTELASDAEHDNLLSAAAHQAVGFEETGLIRCFRKSLRE